MKRSIIFLIAVLVLSMIFSGCESSNKQTETTLPESESLVEEANIHKPADVIGSWALKTITDENFLCCTVEEYCQNEDIKLSTFRDSFTFNADNTVVYEINGKKSNGTYKFDDPTYAMTCQIDNTTYNLTYDNRYDMFYLTDSQLKITKEYGRK